MDQEVWWVHSLMTIRVSILIFMKYKNDIHAPVALQKSFRLYGI